MNDSDSSFVGLDMRRDPANLQPGYYSVGEHVECVDGTVRTRPGNLCVGWGDDYVYTDQYDLMPVRKYANNLDMIRFADVKDGKDKVIIAEKGSAAVCLPGQLARQLTYPPGYEAGENTRLIQAFDKVFLLGGADNRPLVWDGSVLSNFEYADTDPIGGAFVRFPNTEIGCYYKNRLWVVGEDRNQVYPSDILVPTDFYVGNEFFVNQGDSDKIIGLVPYTSNRIIAFKEGSMYSLDNLTGDLSSAEINLISSSTGMVANRSAVVNGNLMIWLSRLGVMAAQLAYDTRLTPETVPLSEPIQPMIDRINWTYAHKASGIVHGERYYLSVPIDDSEANNCVLIYNFKNGAWESVDTYEPGQFIGDHYTYDEHFGPQNFAAIKTFGKSVLVSLNLSGIMTLYRYNHGKTDMAIEGTEDIEAYLTAHSMTTTTGQHVKKDFPFTSIVQTRGYLSSDLSTKLGSRIDVTCETYNPNFTIKLVTSGPGESTVLIEDKTRDRTKRRDYANSATTSAVTNVSNEHSSPYLDDYSIHIESDINSQTGADYPQFYMGNGSTVDDVYLWRKQEFQERFRAYKRGRAPRVRIENNSGTFSLKSVTITQYPRARKSRREV